MGPIGGLSAWQFNSCLPQREEKKRRVVMELRKQRCDIQHVLDRR